MWGRCASEAADDEQVRSVIQPYHDHFALFNCGRHRIMMWNAADAPVLVFRMS